jgi:hypothetical protein
MCKALLFRVAETPFFLRFKVSLLRDVPSFFGPRLAIPFPTVLPLLEDIVLGSTCDFDKDVLLF